MSRPVIGGWTRIFKGKSLVQVVKEGWHENPEIVGSLVYCTIGIIGWLGLLQYSSHLGEKKYMYKTRYIVKRVTDVENPDSEMYS
ncbi:Hypothetical predicted protein [Octopus vulgaris]|uniref:Uncharacterized protein n=1 Tax=Octopus vulgaris TaxID=6645 RepID=A0AA36F1V0_OCTVU|nr:Hypothetical predicted protein [Octopus vulgaris]